MQAAAEQSPSSGQLSSKRACAESVAAITLWETVGIHSCTRRGACSVKPGGRLLCVIGLPCVVGLPVASVRRRVPQLCCLPTAIGLRTGFMFPDSKLEFLD